MAIPVKLDELHLRNVAELWADDAESWNGRRLLHNSGRCNGLVRTFDQPGERKGF